jgi:AraC family transcriptional activator of pobA
MQANKILVCNMDMFDEKNKQFWIKDLDNLLVKFPLLEYPHKQDFYTLLIVESATGEIRIDNQKIRLDQAKAIIIKPRCINSIDINRKAKGKIICFTEDFFSMRYNNNILHQFAFLNRDAKNYVRLSSEQTEYWETILKLLTKEFQLQSKDSETILRSYLNIVLFELDRQINPNETFKNTSIKNDKIKLFETLIEKHFITHKTPSNYAEMLHISPNYLNKICKEETDLTAGELIRKRVMIEAQRLLHYTSFSVNEIAYELGFESTSYFITFFKKQTGISPEMFRKKSK